MYERALELIAPHCDIEQRLRDVPPAARVRGIWMRNIERELERLGRLGPYIDYFETSPSSLAWYPIDGMAIRLAVAGALAASPAELLVGLRQLARGQAVDFANSLLGKALFRLLSTDPKRVLQQGAAARRQGCRYGHWSYDFSQPNVAVVTHTDEWLFLDSHVLGSAEGTFAAVKIPATIDLKTHDAYNGVMTIRW